MLRKESREIIDNLIANMNSEELTYTYTQALRKRSAENFAVVESLGPKAVNLFNTLTDMRKSSNVVDKAAALGVKDSEYLFEGAPNPQAAADERLFSTLGRIGGGIGGALMGGASGLTAGAGVARLLSNRKANVFNPKPSGAQKLAMLLGAGAGVIGGGYLGQRAGKIAGGAPVRALNRLDTIAQASQNR